MESNTLHKERSLFIEVCVYIICLFNKLKKNKVNDQTYPQINFFAK